MSELFGDDTDNLQKQNIMKDTFNWEIPIENVPLPTNGIIYSPDSTVYNKKTIPIKAMTAREEDILTSTALIKDGTVITHLLRSCVTDRSFDVDDLIIGDRNALLISIRITGYGPEYRIISTCQFCSHANNVALNLSEMPIKRLKQKPIEKGKNLFEFKLPVTKKTVLFKYMTAREERERALRSSNIKKHFDSGFDDIVTSTLEHSIVSIDGVEDKNKIKHFVMNMPAFDSKSLRKYMKENEPGIDMTTSYSCASCGRKNEIDIPMTTEFFWPST